MDRKCWFCDEPMVDPLYSAQWVDPERPDPSRRRFVLSEEIKVHLGVEHQDWLNRMLRDGWE